MVNLKLINNRITIQTFLEMKFVIYYMEFRNFFGQNKLILILVLSTYLKTRSTRPKIFTDVFFTKNFEKMKQINKRVTS